MATNLWAMPPEDLARPWLSSAASECPVELDKQRWIESSLSWFADEFGTAVLSRDTVPPDALSWTTDELVTRLCELTGIDPGSVNLAELDRGESSDPKVRAATAVHELCRVLVQDRIDRDRDRTDGERLTDLLSVYFGFGIVSTNAAMRHHRPGSLSSTEWGYALACYSWLRREKEPDWARYLDPGPRVYLEQGLAYLGRATVDGELPTQRLLDKSVTIGDVTVRVTRGAVFGPGSLGLMLPRPGLDP